MKNYISWLSKLSLFKKIGLAAAAGLFLLPILGVGILFANASTITATSKSRANQTQSKIETKTVTETEAIPFETKSVDDSNLAKGQTKNDPEGVNGVRNITYTVTTKDGQQIEKVKTGEVVSTQPVTKVVHNGTYVVPVVTPAPSSSTSSSSAQNSQSTSQRTGAICRDGSLSSATGRGACSHHGGVAHWTY